MLLAAAPATSSDGGIESFRGLPFFFFFCSVMQGSDVVCCSVYTLSCFIGIGIADGGLDMQMAVASSYKSMSASQQLFDDNNNMEAKPKGLHKQLRSNCRRKNPTIGHPFYPSCSSWRTEAPHTSCPEPSDSCCQTW